MLPSRQSLASTALLLSSLFTTSHAADFSDWQSRSIYQLVTDRFAKTVDDGGPCDSGARQYCGGTWKGIVNHLEYISGMGFDAIWISPIVQNIDTNTTYGEAYHGYWPVDFNALNSHFGTQQDLQDLATALHAKGMYLMVDIVINHVAATAVPPALTYTGFTPYNQPAEYHPFCWVVDYSNQTQVEQCWLGDTNVALVDLNTEDPDVVSGHSSWIQNLVSTYKVDGLRIDTVKHIRQSFYPDFLKSAGVMAVGEVLDTRANYTGAYTNFVDTVFNYPQFFDLQTAFLNSTADTSDLIQNFKDTQQYYKNGAMSTVSFSENHDNPRLPSFIADPTLIKNIITWTFGGDGIPVLYYGQEAQYAGGADPMNREALWFTSYSTSVANYQHVSNLNAARKIAFKNKAFATTAASIASSTKSNIAISKYPMLTVVTNGGNSSTAAWTISKSGYNAGEVVVDVLSKNCDTVTVAGDGSMGVAFNLGEPKMYLPATTLTSSGLCGAQAKTAAASFGSLSRPSNIIGALIGVVASVFLMG